MKISLLKYFLSAILLIGTLLFSLPTSVHAQSYIVEPLPLELGPRTAINNNNQIVGSKYVWQNASLSALPELPNTSNTKAWDINNNGQIVGFTDITPSYQHPLIWQNGNVTDLGVPEGMLRCNQPEINDGGQIILGCDDVDNYANYLWQNGQFTNLAPFFPYDINNNGHIAGAVRTNDDQSHPALWENGTITELPLPTNETNCQALAINDNEQIVGECFTELSQKIYLWDNGQIIPIHDGNEITKMSLHTINNLGEIVGEIYTPAFPQGKGFVWKDGVVTVLDLLPQDIYGGAIAINDNSWITGATVANMVKKAVLWKPVSHTQITALAPAKVWISKGIFNLGVRLDLRAEAYIDNTLVSSGQINNEMIGSGGFNQATLETIPFASFSPINASEGSQLKIKLLVRNACASPGVNFGNATLWFNNATANSHFGATIGEETNDYFLRNNFALSTTQGTGSRQSIVTAAGTKCSPFKSFGTWTLSQ